MDGQPQEKEAERTCSSSGTCPLPATTPYVAKHHAHATPWVAFCVVGSVVGGVGVLTFPFVVMPLFRGHSLPYMATPVSKLQQAWRFLQQQPSNKAVGPRRWVDLGSGDGETVYQALQLRNETHDGAKHVLEPYYYAHCTGVELNTTLYGWSCGRRWFWTRDERSRSRFLCRNMFHPSLQSSLSEAHSIFIFGIPSLMTAISQLLLRNRCPPGTYIICYRFPLPVDDSSEEDDIPSNSTQLLPARLIYDQDEMRIYECIHRKVHKKDTNTS